LDNAFATEGDGWVMLHYKNGDIYHGESGPTGLCKTTTRSVLILITCASDDKNQLVFNDEFTGDQPCYYSFNLHHKDLCPTKEQTTTAKTSPLTTTNPPSSSQSVFTVLFFIVLSIVLVYLGVGMAFKRIVYGSKGFSAVPNHEFWIRFGNLIADGCDYIFRCRACAVGPLNPHDSTGYNHMPPDFDSFQISGGPSGLVFSDEPQQLPPSGDISFHLPSTNTPPTKATTTNTTIPINTHPQMQFHANFSDDDEFERDDNLLVL
jgi:hypothetical protein